MLTGTPLPAVEVDGLALRELPVEEWPRLAEAAGPLHGVDLPDTVAARILVAETPDGAIVAYWVLSAMYHLDPLWIATAYHKRSHFLLALIGALLTILEQESITHVFAIIADGDQPLNGQLAEKLGLTRLPGALYAGALREPVEGT